MAGMGYELAAAGYTMEEAVVLGAAAVAEGARARAWVLVEALGPESPGEVEAGGVGCNDTCTEITTVRSLNC